jgi:glycosyltransferase involved in cell wall biosynthesis
MRIGIDCRQIYDVEKNDGAGVERYVFNLTKALLHLGVEHKFVLFFDRKISDKTIKSLKRIRDFKVVKVRNRLPFFSNHVFFTFKLWAEFLNWMIFPANTMPFLYIGKSLLVVHDMAIYSHPQWFSGEQWFLKLIVMPSSLAKATKIITISKTTRNELLGVFKMKQSKVRTVYPGVNDKKIYSEMATREVLTKFNIIKPFLFFVGTIEPRKNLVNLFLAFEKFKKNNPLDVELVVAGAKGWKDSKIFSQLERSNKNFKQPIIRYVGQITDHEKDILMQHSTVFIFPSRYEGFGLPVFEAMAAGAPVITSNNSAMAELIINNEALKVDPNKVDEIVYAIKKILCEKNFQEALRKKGSELVSRFKWSQTAREVLAAIELP